MSDRRPRGKRQDRTPPTWIPDAIIVVRCKDEAASSRLLAAIESAVRAFVDPAILRVVTMDENVTQRELEAAGAAALASCSPGSQTTI